MCAEKTAAMPEQTPARPYCGAMPGERRAERRRKLVEAGYNLFGSSGFTNTRIEQVCAEAGVGIRALYEEFENLNGLFRTVYDHVMDGAYEAVAAMFEQTRDASPEDRLRRFIHVYLHQMLDDPRSGRIVSIESSRLDLFLGNHRKQTLNKFAALAAAVPQADADLFNADIRVWSLMFAGGINETVVDAVLARKRGDIDGLSRKIADLYIRTLKP